MNNKNNLLTTIDERANLVKNILLLSSGILLLIVSILAFFDFLLFINTFHFSYAAYKEFYLATFDITIAQILTFIAIIPVVVAFVMFIIPYMLSEIAVGFFDESIIMNDRFYLIYAITYFGLGIVFFDLGTQLLDLPIIAKYINSIMVFISYIVIYIMLLYINVRIVVILLNKPLDITKLFIVYCIVEYILSCVKTDEIVSILALLFLLIFMPVILLFFLDNKLNSIKKPNKNLEFLKINKNHAKHISKNKIPKSIVTLAILLVSICIFIFLTHFTINQRQWSSFDANESSILKNGSLNLFLNRVFLDTNHNTADINVSNYHTHYCIGHIEKIHLGSAGNVKVLSLSDSKKLYFIKESNNSDICIYAIQIINIKGKDVFKPVYTGSIKNDIETKQ